MDRTTLILKSEVRKRRAKAEMKRREAERLDKEADEIEEKITSE